MRKLRYVRDLSPGLRRKVKEIVCVIDAYEKPESRRKSIKISATLTEPFGEPPRAYLVMLNIELVYENVKTHKTFEWNILLGSRGSIKYAYRLFFHFDWEIEDWLAHNKGGCKQLVAEGKYDWLDNVEIHIKEERIKLPFKPYERKHPELYRLVKEHGWKRVKDKDMLDEIMEMEAPEAVRVSLWEDYYRKRRRPVMWKRDGEYVIIQYSDYGKDWVVVHHPSGDIIAEEKTKDRAIYEALYWMAYKSE